MWISGMALAPPSLIVSHNVYALHLCLDPGFIEGPQDVDNVLFSFASTCLAAGANCTLNFGDKFDSVSSLLAKIDETLDVLYAHPVPVYDMDQPVVVTAANLRQLMFQAMYKVSNWQLLAEHLNAAFHGNYTGIAKGTTLRVQRESSHKQDGSSFSALAIVVRL
jgi:hypothetical protein